jgi:hypothetical protein
MSCSWQNHSSASGDHRLSQYCCLPMTSKLIRLEDVDRRRAGWLFGPGGVPDLAVDLPAGAAVLAKWKLL